MCGIPLRLGEEKKKEEERSRQKKPQDKNITTGQKYNGLPYSIGQPAIINTVNVVNVASHLTHMTLIMKTRSCKMLQEYIQSNNSRLFPQLTVSIFTTVVHFQFLCLTEILHLQFSFSHKDFIQDFCMFLCNEQMTVLQCQLVLLQSAVNATAIPSIILFTHCSPPQHVRRTSAFTAARSHGSKVCYSQLPCVCLLLFSS